MTCPECCCGISEEYHWSVLPCTEVLSSHQLLNNFISSQWMFIGQVQGTAMLIRLQTLSQSCCAMEFSKLLFCRCEKEFKYTSSICRLHRANKIARTPVWVSQTQICYIMIIRSELDLLSSLDPKRPRTVKISFKQPLEPVPQSIMETLWVVLKKVSRMRALGLTDPWCYFSSIF